MKELITHIVKALVDTPEKIEVREIAGEKATIIELKVAEIDRGKIIGKQGRIIKAIRLILSAAGAKLGKRVSLELIE